MFFQSRDEIKDLNDETRRNAAGSFIELPDGVTHYELGGDESGERVVLIHGFSVPYFIYDPTFKFLTESGFHVLRYDLFGRGFSDRPAARYDIDLFLNQLTGLLDALRFASTGLSTGSRPVNLIGLSLGGIIASAYTVYHPERVNKLVLIDPAGARPISFSLMQRAALRRKGFHPDVLVMTATGLYRYFMNDLVETIGFFRATPLLRFVQKGKGVTSLTGEKLYEAQAIEAVRSVSARFGLR